MEPYIPNLRHPRGEEMKVDLEDPAPHQIFFYNQAIEELAENLGVDTDSELIPDGGRTLEEQLIDNIIFQHWNDRDQHRIHEDYVSDGLYQDSGEDLPLGFYVTYDSGPEYSIFDFDDENRAEWHKDTAIEHLEEEGYNTLIEEF